MIVKLTLSGNFEGNAEWEVDNEEFNRLKALSYDEVAKAVEKELEFDLFDSVKVTDLKYEFKDIS